MDGIEEARWALHRQRVACLDAFQRGSPAQVHLSVVALEIVSKALWQRIVEYYQAK